MSEEPEVVPAKITFDQRIQMAMLIARWFEILQGWGVHDEKGVFRAWSSAERWQAALDKTAASLNAEMTFGAAAGERSTGE